MDACFVSPFARRMRAALSLLASSPGTGRARARPRPRSRAIGRRHARWLCALAVATILLPPAGASGAAAALPLDQLRVPPGFHIELFARVPNARQMALGKDTVFVGSMHAGTVTAVPLAGERRPRVIARGLDMPVGVALRDGDLYVSAVSRILRFRNIEARLSAPPRAELVTDALPADTHHGWKFIGFGPDGKLYVPVGAPCNVCKSDPDRYATINRLDIASGKIEVVARGVRNTVGFDWHPRSGELWFTDNGRDWLGDDLPPDELNRLAQPGTHFGFPFCHGADIADPEFGRGESCARYTAPIQLLGAHVAPLGMRFYTGKAFPPTYRDAVLIAEHGSWNRSRKNGYRVSVVRLDANRATHYETLVSGWMKNETAWGRPADVLVLPDGSLLISDDQAGAIYRLSYRRPS